MKLTLIRGLPGAGKSTWAKKNLQCLILENDMFQIINGKYCWSSEGTKKAISLVMSMTEQTLLAGADVCVCNTFTKKKYVEAYKRFAEKFGAEFEVIRLAGEFKNTHNVPEFIFNNMKKNFEDWPGEKIINPS